MVELSYLQLSVIVLWVTVSFIACYVVHKNVLEEKQKEADKHFEKFCEALDGYEKCAKDLESSYDEYEKLANKYLTDHKINMN